MVYCGKPSKGCGLCRSRRIKCDRLSPACSQCTRVSRSCPGYRNEADLVFRDLTETITIKFQNNKKQSAVLSTAIKHDKDEMLTPRCFKQPYACANDPAALFFFNDYVVFETRKQSSMFDMLPSMYESSRPGSPLVDVIIALGLLIQSHTKCAPEVMTSARARYVAALHNTNAKIRDPKSAIADETLVVVILLGLYEDNTSVPGSLELWSKHVQGASALLDMRGVRQLKTRVGRQLIANLRTSTIANCLLKHTSVPDCIMRWSNLLREYESPDEATATSLAGIVASFCSLQERIKTSEYSESVRSVLADALVLDEELEIWAELERSERPYSTIKAEPTSDLAFEGAFHVYHDLSAATHWNYYRSTRIMLHEIILKQLKQHKMNEIDSYFESTTPNENKIELSKSIIMSLSQNVCASVRYCLGFSKKVNTSYQPEKGANAKLLLWPLYTAGNSACVPISTSLWIADVFDFIAKVTGVRKGAGLAKALRAWPCALEPTISPVAHWRDVVLTTDRIRYPESF